MAMRTVITAPVFWTAVDATSVTFSGTQMALNASGPKCTTYRELWEEMPKPQVQNVKVKGIEYKLVKFTSAEGTAIENLDQMLGHTPRCNIVFSYRVRPACCLL